MISSHKSFRQDLYTFVHSKNCRNLSTEQQKTSSKIFCLLIFFVIYKYVLVFYSRIYGVDKIYKGIICNIQRCCIYLIILCVTFFFLLFIYNCFFFQFLVFSSFFVVFLSVVLLVIIKPLIDIAFFIAIFIVFLREFEDCAKIISHIPRFNEFSFN